MRFGSFFPQLSALIPDSVAEIKDVPPSSLGHVSALRHSLALQSKTTASDCTVHSVPKTETTMVQCGGAGRKAISG
ncbi:hypothetical protein MC885_017186 [Smutsia gigantea]|nr:hypothetical protein MC885_017186 [Smutsia gigantea]